MKVLSVLAAAVATAAATADASVGGGGIHLVMTADPGYYSGLSEGHVVLEHMRNTVNISRDLDQCAAVVEGTLGPRQTPISLITTGIGHDNAASCMVDVLRWYEHRGVAVLDVIYMGTSGWTPRVGGWFDPVADPTCSAPKVATTGLVGIGDTCISPMTFLLNCGFCTWTDGTLGECAAPACTKHDDSSVFGQCSFYKAEKALADSLYKLATSLTYQPRGPVLHGYVDQYWRAVWNGLNESQAPRPQNTPVLYDYTVCSETATYDLWSGTPKDYQCRLYLSQMITKATGKITKPDEVLCVAAMEGPGWVSVLMKKATKTGKAIPFVNVRAASNYAITPLYKNGEGVLLRNDSWITASKMENFTKEGYQYAIGVASKIVLAHYGL